MSKQPVLFAYTANRYADVAPDPNDHLFDRFMRDRLDIYRRLRERGHEIFVSTDGQRSFMPPLGREYVLAYPVDTSGKLLSPQRVGVEDIGVIINRTSRPLVVPDARVMVNNSCVYWYGESKLDTYRDILEPNGGLLTLPVTNGTELEAALEQLGPSVALKKNNGSLTEGIYLTEDPDSARHLMDVGALTIEGGYVAQRRYDFTSPWPTSITAVSNDQHAPLGAPYLPGMPKELRMYFWLIAEPDKEPEVICYPVGCVEVEAATHMTPTGRRWIGLDPASVPQRLYDKTTAAARVLCGLTGSRAIYGCDDWAYGYPIGGSPKPRWVTVEGNFCGPRLLGPREYPQIGKVLHERYVDFIDRAMAISN